jgi:hypothetical protein
MGTRAQDFHNNTQPSDTYGYTSPGAYGLSQVGNAIGDTVSKYVTPAVKAVGDTFFGVDDFKRLPSEVRSGDWAGAAKSAGTGIAEVGTTMYGGAVLRTGGKGLAFAAGKLGKYVPELETSAETGGRLITGAKQRVAGALLAGSQAITGIAHGATDFGAKAASSYSHVVGEAPSTVSHAVEDVVKPIVQGAEKAGAEAVKTVKTVANEGVDIGRSAVNSARAALGIHNADAPDQAPVKYQQEQKQQQGQNATGDGDSSVTPPRPPKKEPATTKKPDDFNFDVNVPGQNAQITRVY